jgi:hypothetical protein
MISDAAQIVFLDWPAAYVHTSLTGRRNSRAGAMPLLLGVSLFALFALFACEWIDAAEPLASTVTAVATKNDANAAIAATATNPATNATPPNFVVIFMDDLGSAQRSSERRDWIGWPAKG